MESLTYQKNLKVSPKKLRMIRDNIYKMSPKEALDYLLYAPTKPAKTYYKVLNSAIQNAVNSLKVQADVLQFKLLTIEEGRKLSRFKAGSKGMAKPIVRRYSHIKVILVEKAQSKKAEKEIEKKAKHSSAKATAGDAKAEKKSAVKKETVKKAAPKAEKKETEVKK